VVNQLTMGKTYRKSHDSEKAAKIHTAKIKKRGGKVTTSKLKRKTVLEYTFSKK